MIKIYHNTHSVLKGIGALNYYNLIINGIKCFFSIFIFLLIFSGCQTNSNSNSKAERSGSMASGTNGDYFQEIGKEIGLDFVHSIGDNELSNIVESSGAGAAFLDYDQDGFIDQIGR